jgi:hypothetical protein
MTLAAAAYLVWFLVLVVALAAVVRGGRVPALVGALVAWCLVAATEAVEQRSWPVTSWRFLGLMGVGLAGLILFVVSVARGKASGRPRA